jgi:hypothetical protein
LALLSYRGGGALARAAAALLLAVLLTAPLAGVVSAAAAVPTDHPALRQAAGRAPYFPETGFAIDEPRFADYFRQRGGVATFGFPISRTFQFLGRPTQFFQRIVLQLGPDGAARPLNLLDPGMLAYTRMNGSTFPAPDERLAAAAPAPRQPDYATAVVQFVRTHAPEAYEGQPVRFFSTFMETVSAAEAFPNGGDRALLPLINLEIWGVPTSAPATDPNNGGFVYQRFQRGIMHYDAACRCTQGLLLADYLKALLTGDNLPSDLEQQARGSVFLRQYAPDAVAGTRRPGLLPDTDLTGAFVAQHGPDSGPRTALMSASAVASEGQAGPLRTRLRADRALGPVLDALEESGAQPVIEALVKADADIVFAPLPRDAQGRTREFARYTSVGVYGPIKRTIALSAAVQGGDPKALATLIVHEGTHLKDDLAGADKRTMEACFQFEIRAFTQQALAWQGFYGPGGKADPKDDLDAWLNSWLATYRAGPTELEKRVRDAYDQPRPTGCRP